MAEPHIRYETNELRLLFELSQALEGATDISDHLEAVLELMARYTGMLRGALTLLEPGDAGMVVEAAYGPKPPERKTWRHSLDEGVAARVIEAGKPVVMPRGGKEPLFLSRTGASGLSKEDISFICVPVLVDGKAAGALLADRLFADSVRPEEDVRLLQVLASLVARAMQVRFEFNAMHSAVVEENRRLQQMVRARFHAGDLAASSSAMRSVLEELALVASSGSTVLLRGEGGTGKELAASIIHSNSQRSGRPFIKALCAAQPEALLEGELFGYEPGAVAAGRKGRVEMAHGGTLFLDEVADLGPALQARLLRLLQDREVERVGGGTALRVDVRLIAATSRNLEDLVAQGRFRQDLYYRLSVFPVILPPLRERRGEIMALAAHFAESAGQAGGRKIERISAPAASMLVNYAWPGNIRELESVIERAVILSGTSGIIEAHHLPAWLQDLETRQGQSLIDTGGKLEDAVAGLEKRMLMHALAECGGNMNKAARQLGITERIMGLRMKKYKLDYKSFRKAEALGRPASPNPSAGG